MADCAYPAARSRARCGDRYDLPGAFLVSNYSPSTYHAALPPFGAVRNLGLRTTDRIVNGDTASQGESRCAIAESMHPAFGAGNSRRGQTAPRYLSSILVTHRD